MCYFFPDYMYKAIQSSFILLLGMGNKDATISTCNNRQTIMCIHALKKCILQILITGHQKTWFLFMAAIKGLIDEY